MRTVFERNIPESFVLDEKRVISIVRVLQDYAGEPSISATCADDATRSFENVEELFEYENPLNRRIISIDMDSYGAGSKENKSANIKFGTRYRAPTIYIRVSGPEEKASIAIRKLDEVAAGSRPWHSRLSKGDMPPFGVMGSVIFGTLVWFSLWPLLFSYTLALPTGIALSLLMLALSLAFSVVLGVRHVTRILFPPAIFLIGQENARHATMHWQQKLALGALVTAGLAVGGVILRWLLSMF